MASYSEACFIKAETLFRQGDKSGAFIAYKEFVFFCFFFVNDQIDLFQIGVWTSEQGKKQSCPSITHNEQTDFDKFKKNALGNSSDITLGKILTQKMLAMPYSNENWNDMRRCDYDTNIFFYWF